MKNVLLITLLLFSATVYAQYQLYPSKLYESGEASFKAEDYRACELSMSKFLMQPHRNKTLDPNTYYMRGVSYYKLDQVEKSVADLRTAIQSNSANMDRAFLILGTLYFKLNKTDEALTTLSSAIEKSNNKELISEAYYERGLVKETLQSINDSMDDFKKAVEENPANEKAVAKLGKTNTPSLSSRGNGTESIQLDKAINSVSNLSVISGLDYAYKDEKRYALVVGNSSYSKEIGFLKNPANDAQDIASELRKCNFEVELLLNATHRQIEIAANKLFKTLSDGPKDKTVGLFFYAGHGVQFEGVNYLVPIDASITTPSDVVYACYPIDKILGKMEFANSRMNIVILDACRSNPFPATVRSGSPQGLAQVRAAKGSYVAFATAPGSVASDGNGRNGLYTQELLKALRKPNTTIEQMFKEVRQRVSDGSNGQQNTWDNSNIVGDFYFNLKN
jgi:tetratricopeptide (TPR) repeat protein